MKRIIGAALLGLLLVPPAFAQIPALKGTSQQEAARIKALIAGAEKEGGMSYIDAVIQPSTNDALVAAFREYYGLPSSFQVHYTLSNTSGLITRIQQEIDASRVTTDVVDIASPSWVFEKAKNGNILKYASPQYAHYTKVFEMGLAKKDYFAFNGSYVFVPMWNADKLNFKGTSLKDVIGAVPTGRMSIGDVSKSAAYLATYTGQRDVMNKKFFQELAAMKPNFLVRSEQIASRLVSGEDLMAYSGMPTRAFQYNQRGAHLKFMFPKEGVVLLPQEMFILAKAPHPNAAKLWLDFVLSETGQSILAKKEALISGRDGFKSPLPEYAPGIDSLHLIKVDWEHISPDKLKEIRKSWTAIFNP